MREPSVRVLQVIEVRFLRGSGVALDPVREVVRWYSMDGVLIVEVDPVKALDERTS